MFGKFAGFGFDQEGRPLAERVAVELQKAIDFGMGLPIEGRTAGWLLFRWHSGAKQAQGWTRAVEGYLRFRVRSGTRCLEVAGAWERLKEMIGVNLVEAGLTSRSPEFPVFALGKGASIPCADGRMARWEWLNLSTGHWVKPNAYTHSLDHTLVGEQPIHWDLATLAAEDPGFWEEHGRRLLSMLREEEGVEIDEMAFNWWRLGYLALRIGQCTFCAGASSGRRQEAQQKALTAYKSRAATLLAQLSG